MKVYWIVSNYPHQHDVQAGIFYKIFAEAMVKAGVDLSVIAPTPYAGVMLAALSPTWKRYHISPKEEKVNGVKIFRPRYITHPDEAYRGIPHRFMLRAIKKLGLTPPDIIHGFGAYPASYAAVEYASSLHVPGVTTFIGSDVNEYPYHNERSLSRFKHIVDLSERVLTIGAALAEKVKALTGKQAGVVHMPIRESSAPKLSKDLARKTMGLPVDKFIVLYAGNISASKGVPELCEALSGMEDAENVHAVFVGNESPVSIANAGLKNATWMGQLENTKVMEVMCAVDLLVLPSHNEGIPGVIKEAGQVQLPVLATNVGGIPEIIGNDRGYMIEPRNAAIIRNSILSIKNNYSEALERAERLHAFVMQTFVSSAVVEKQLKIYNDLIASKKK